MLLPPPHQGVNGLGDAEVFPHLRQQLANPPPGAAETNRLGQIVVVVPQRRHRRAIRREMVRLEVYEQFIEIKNRRAYGHVIMVCDPGRLAHWFWVLARHPLPQP
jgi:hypothetical protein